jgi:hypothetical protein
MLQARESYLLNILHITAVGSSNIVASKFFLLNISYGGMLEALLKASDPTQCTN